MSTIDGLLIGLVAGGLGTAGLWAFVASESGPVAEVAPIRDLDRRAGRADVAVAPPPARPEPRVEPTVAPVRKASRARAARAAAAPAQLEATVDAVLMPGGHGGPGAPDPDPIDRLETRATGVDGRRPRLGFALGSGAELALSDGLDAGVQWDVRLLAEPYEHLGLEVAYVGTAGAGNDSTSGEVLAKWYPQAERPIRYYALAGVGWRRFHAQDTDIATVPVGVGLALHRGDWRADTRLTLRAASRSAFHTLGLTAHVGRAF